MLALGHHVDTEATELGLGRGLAGPEIDPPSRHEIEHRDPLGGAGRVVVSGCGLDDAVAQADVLGSLAHRGQKDLGGRRVGVLLEEVVLDLPHVVEPEPVGQLDLVEGVGDQLLFAGVGPGAWQLVFVEEAELHSVTAGAVQLTVNVLTMPSSKWLSNVPSASSSTMLQKRM